MEKRKSGSAVVLGADVNGLGHIRSLGEMGIFTYVVCSGTNFENLARFSKYCAPIYVPKDTPDYETKLKKKLIDLAEAGEKKPVLYATSDYFINFIALNRTALKDQYLFNIPKNDILELIINKYNTDKVARNSGLRSPITMRLPDFNKAVAIAESIGFPCIIKPQNSYTSAFPGKNIIIKNELELTAFIEKYPELKKHLIIQEIIPGDEKNIFQCTAYVGKHVPMQLFTMQKIHQFPPGYGITALGRSTIIMTLMAQTKKILKDIGYTGFASVEYKKSDKNHQYYLIEINPRLPWYNTMFFSCGVNFPYLAYLDLKRTHLLPTDAVKQTDNVYWIHLRNEIAGLWKRKKSGIAINVSEYIKDIFKARSFAYFDPYDLKPFFKANIEFVKSALSKAFRGKDPEK